MPRLMDDTQDEDHLIADEKEHCIREVTEKGAPDVTMDDREPLRSLGDAGETLFDSDFKAGWQFGRSAAEPFDGFSDVVARFWGNEKAASHLPRNSSSLISSQGRAVSGLR